LTKVILTVIIFEQNKAEPFRSHQTRVLFGIIPLRIFNTSVVSFSVNGKPVHALIISGGVLVSARKQPKSMKKSEIKK
jgi:hypothetical protein